MRCEQRTVMQEDGTVLIFLPTGATWRSPSPPGSGLHGSKALFSPPPAPWLTLDRLGRVTGAATFSPVLSRPSAA